MRATIARLEEIVANETRRHRGIRPVEQGEGDSFVLGFGKASDAVACALAIQRATAGERWPHSGVLLVRMALNSGELDAPQGKFDGTPINRCARIRDLAHGGQVLVARSTHNLVEDRLPLEATLTALGAYRLRDLARPEEIFQLCHPELPADFPPLRSLDALPNRSELAAQAARRQI
jgi:class 3 adenylate cyclase